MSDRLSQAMVWAKEADDRARAAESARDQTKEAASAAWAEWDEATHSAERARRHLTDRPITPKQPSDDELPWIIRINAQWFPVGLRIIVRCGLAGAPQDDALMLRENGWHKTEAFALGTRKALIAAGEDYGWHRRFAQHHMTEMGLYMLYVGLEQAAYADARAMDGFLHETHTAFDPRRPTSVFE